MVVLAHATGLRQSELLGIRWADLDLDGGWLRVRQQMGRDGRFKDLKAEAGRRAIPLPANVVTLLLAHRDRRASCAPTPSNGTTTTWSCARRLADRSASATRTGHGRAS